MFALQEQRRSYKWVVRHVQVMQLIKESLKVRRPNADRRRARTDLVSASQAAGRAPLDGAVTRAPLPDQACL